MPVPTYGQTFTAGPGLDLLDGITIVVGSDSTEIPFQAYVYAWTGSAISGPALFTSGVETAPDTSGSYFNFTISTGEVPLTDGDQYIVFFSTIGDPGVGDGFWAEAPASSYTGGSFQYSTATDFSDLFSSWNQNGSLALNSAFEFGFAPEPSTVVLISTGIGLLAAIRKRAKS